MGIEDLGTMGIEDTMHQRRVILELKKLFGKLDQRRPASAKRKSAMDEESSPYSSVLIDLGRKSRPRSAQPAFRPVEPASDRVDQVSAQKVMTAADDSCQVRSSRPLLPPRPSTGCLSTRHAVPTSLQPRPPPGGQAPTRN